MTPTDNRKASRRWVAIVIALLGGHVALMTIAVTLAVRGHGAAGVTPDYYQKALNWDESRATAARTEALGWTVTLTPEPANTPDGQRVLLVEAADREGGPVTDAAVLVHGYHRLSTSEQTLNHAAEEAPGRYAVRVPLTRTGAWRFTVRIERGVEVYERAFDQRILDGPEELAKKAGAL